MVGSRGWTRAGRGPGRDRDALGGVLGFGGASFGVHMGLHHAGEASGEGGDQDSQAAARTLEDSDHLGPQRVLVRHAGQGHGAGHGQLLAVHHTPPQGDLTGLLELIPWVKQWHNELDPKHGVRMGDYFEDFVNEEIRALGLTFEQINAWTPPKKKRTRKPRTKAVRKDETEIQAKLA